MCSSDVLLDSDHDLSSPHWSLHSGLPHPVGAEAGQEGLQELVALVHHLQPQCEEEDRVNG